MSMPIIDSSTIEREQSVTDMIESIALEQTALSHILNAEGEKLQAIISMPDHTAASLLAVNKSVQRMVDAITKLEMHLHTKLSLFDTILPPTSFFFYKLETDTLKALAGGVFSLTDIEGNEIATATSAATGRVTFTGIPKGAYSLSETQPPEGYRPSLGMFPVEVKGRGNVTIVGMPAEQFRAFNTPYSDLTVLKVNPTQAPLEGGVFELVGPGDTLTQASGADGNAIFSRLEPGDYQLTEITPPPGYDADSTTHTVTVSLEGIMLIDGIETTTITVTNQLPPQEP